MCHHIFVYLRLWLYLQNLYDNTCAMREKRLDIEEALTEEKKNNETLKKELESMNKKLKVIINALKTAQNDLEAFQVCYICDFRQNYVNLMKWYLFFLKIII